MLHYRGPKQRDAHFSSTLHPLRGFHSTKSTLFTRISAIIRPVLSIPSREKSHRLEVMKIHKFLIMHLAQCIRRMFPKNRLCRALYTPLLCLDTVSALFLLLRLFPFLISFSFCSAPKILKVFRDVRQDEGTSGHTLLPSRQFCYYDWTFCDYFVK